MLSRVADSLYWMARSIERAENLACLIDVNLQLLLDFQNLDSEMLHNFWEPVLLSTGDQELFTTLYEEESSASVTEFITSNERNPNSIVSCIRAARENARMVRDQLSEEMWEELNSLYLFVTSPKAGRMLHNNPYSFFQEIRRSSLLFQGITNATIPRDQGYEFIQLGKFLERADKSTRIIDTKTYLPEPTNEILRGIDSLQWMAILRSCSAAGAYRTLCGGDLRPDNLLHLLIFSPQFPRSVRYCVQQIDESLHHISGVGPNYYSNEAERVSGRCLSDLNFGSLQEVHNRGLHVYLDDLQTALNQIGKGIFDTYVLLPDTVLLGSESGRQQQQQQQQQQQ